MVSKKEKNNTGFSGEHVLFVCQGNSIRSQMAEGLFRAATPDGIHVYSAAARRPVGLDRSVVKVMKEIGIDVTEQASNGFDMIPLEKIDLVVDLRTSGDKRDLPDDLQDAKYRSWPTGDPYTAPASGEDGLAYFRAVRDELKLKIDELLATAGNPT